MDRDLAFEDFARALNGYGRLRRRARFAMHVSFWGLLGGLALMELAEIALGFPHLPVLLPAGGVLVWVELDSHG